MSDLISHCLDRLNLKDDVRIKQRAQQYQGQLSSVPNKLFDKGPNLKAVVCIQLAYESMNNYDWDNKLAGQLAGCTLSAYETCVSKVRQQLGIQRTVTFDALTVACGSSTMLTPLKELWHDFSNKYVEQFTGIKKRNAQEDLEKPCWKGATVYCCAKAFGDNLNKDKIHTLCSCSITELNKCIKIVQSTSQDKLSELKNNTKKVKEDTSKKRKRKEVEETVKEEKPAVIKKPISGIVSMIHHQDYKKTKKYVEFMNWKATLIKQLKFET